MTLEQTGAVMDLLTANYPWLYRGKRVEEREKALVTWADAFQDEPLDMVIAAVKALIAIKENDRSPVPGEVKAIIRRFREPKELTEVEAWKLVSDAAKNSGYCAREEFERLPPLVQRLVGSHSTLREYAMMDSQTLGTVVGSNFMRSYKEVRQQAREEAMLPADVKAMLGQMGDGLALKQEEAPPRIDAAAKNAALRRAYDQIGGIEKK